MVKKIVLVSLIFMTPFSGVCATDQATSSVESTQKQSRFTPETVAKIKKVALISGISAAALVSVYVIYVSGWRQGFHFLKPSTDDLVDSNGELTDSLVETNKDLFRSKLLGLATTVAGTALGFVGGGRLKAAKAAAKGGRALVRVYTQPELQKGIFSAAAQAWETGFSAGYIAGRARGIIDGIKILAAKIPDSLKSLKSSSGSGRAIAKFLISKGIPV